MQTAETTLTITSEELSVLRKALREFATKHDTGPAEEELADNIIYKLRNLTSVDL